MPTFGYQAPTRSGGGGLTPTGTRASGSREPAITATGKAPVTTVTRTPGTRASGAREPLVGVSTLPFDIDAPGGLGDYSRSLNADDGGGPRSTGGATGATGATGGAGPDGVVGTADDTDDPDERTDMGDDTLNATLAAIEAEFGMTKQQLLNDEGEAGRQYRQILAGMQQQRRDDLEATRDDLVARGILRSGETLENEARLQRGYAQNVSAAQGDRDLQLANVAAQRAALGPQQAAREATATADHEAAIRDFEAMKALAQGGL